MKYFSYNANKKKQRNIFSLSTLLLVALIFSIPGMAGTWDQEIGMVNHPLRADQETWVGWFDTLSGKELGVGGHASGSTIAEDIGAIGPRQTTLRLRPGNHIVNSDLTIPANIALKLERGATLSVAAAKTLTINGGLDAGLYQIFICEGTGKVVFGPGGIKEAYPQWWGAAGDGRTNDLAAIRAAVASGAKVVTFADTGSPYLVDDATYPVSNQEIRLLNRATIRSTSATAVPFKSIFNLGGDVHDITIRGGVLEGLNTSGLGTFDERAMGGLINYVGGNVPNNITVEGVEVRYSHCAGMLFASPTSTGINIIRCRIHHCAAFAIAAAGDMRIEDCDIHDNQYAGVDGGGPWVYGDLKVLHNRIYRNGGVNGGGAQDLTWSGILLFGTRRALIQGNHVHGNGIEGIRVDVPSLNSIPQNVVIQGNIIYGHAMGNSAWTPAGIRITGGKNINVIGNNCYDNYDNYVFQVRDAADGYVGLESLVVKGNISANGSRYGYWVGRPGTKHDDPTVPIGEIISGLLIQGNISNRDTVPFKCDAPGTFWVRDNVTIPKTETLGAELLADGGFENAAGPSKWAGQKGAVLARVADHRPGSPGAHALNVTRGASYICALSDNIPLIEGKLYKLEVWLKRITDADTRPLALVAVAGGGAGQVRTWWDKPEELPVNTWKKHTAYFHPAATANYQVALWGGVNTGDQFRFDDVSLKEVINMPALGNIN